jgi:hypothetical protein
MWEQNYEVLENAEPAGQEKMRGRVRSCARGGKAMGARINPGATVQDGVKDPCKISKGPGEQNRRRREIGRGECRGAHGVARYGAAVQIEVRIGYGSSRVCAESFGGRGYGTGVEGKFSRAGAKRRTEREGTGRSLKAISA